MPQAYDAVIMIEDVNFEQGQAVIIKPAFPGSIYARWGKIWWPGCDGPSLTTIGPQTLFTAAINELEVVKPLVAQFLPARI